MTRLADDVELEVIYSDDTRLGCLLSGRLGTSIRERCQELFQHWREHGGGRTIAASAGFLPAALADFYRAPGELLSEVLHPPASAIRPSALVVSREQTEVTRVELSGDVASDLARWVGEWRTLATKPAAGPAAALFERLESVAAFTSSAAPAPLRSCDGHFVGHATVAIGDARGRVLVDPYLLPRSTRFPPTYQPIVPGELDPLLAVCITHSHPDHFSPGSLLKLGAQTKIFVPRVPRESALSVAMALRLAELGFDNVEEIGWHEERELPGGIGRITALPFFGEQPTVGARFHSDVRNQGNVYLVELHGKTYLTVADSGRDSEGDAQALAERLRVQVGRLDVLFGGYRAFPQYPIEYLGSSVPEYLLFVPPEAWLQRQKIMYDADELIDLAEAWRARHVVPYACGGAPWYWRRGLGPTLDVLSDQPKSRADPTPEEAADAARWRTGPEDDPLPSPVRVLLLRPGDGFRVGPEDLVVAREDPHAWPYASRLPGRDRPAASAVRSLWAQFDITIAAGDERENAWSLFRRLVPLITDLKATGHARTFFFQWKPPGYRVRVELTAEAGREAEMRLREELERVVRLGVIASWVPAIYEPEHRVFGGEAAMAAVHRYFDVDTSLYIDRLALIRSTMFEPVAAHVLWLAFVLDDLATRCTGDANECWDVYMSLLERHGIDADATAEPLPAEGLVLSRAERGFLARYRDEHERLADALDRIAGEGALGTGRRELLANVLQFQLNRHQLDGAGQHAVLQKLRSTRDPQRRPEIKK